jgi:ribosomal protein L14E/L6E/L27E
VKPIPYEVGRVVQSTQGRDRGRLFLIMSVVDDRFVLMADGDLRKAEHPKRKKIIHLHAKPIFYPELAQRLRENKAVTDSELRKTLENAAMQALPTCKEGCGLVQE